MRAGVADDYALHYQSGIVSSGRAFGSDNFGRGCDLSGAAHSGLRCHLLYGGRRTYHGRENRNRHAPGRVSASASAVEYLL